MTAWSLDENEHVRRLASEGSRPRLPWGLRLTALVQDPRPTGTLLERLKDDPHPYVRATAMRALGHSPDVVDTLIARLSDPDRSVRDAAAYAHEDIFTRWYQEMVIRGVLFHPLQFENLFVSLVHTDADIDETLDAADAALDVVAREFQPARG